MSLDVTAKYSQPEVVDFWRRFSQTGLQAAEAAIIARYAPPPGRLLDLGCGGGRALLALAPLGYDVVGLDLARPMLRVARALGAARGHCFPLVEGRLEALPLRVASFDYAIILIAALQHVRGRAARQAVLTTVHDSLRPGGRLILALDNVAPALTCYLWWARQRLARGNVAPTPATAHADAALQARRRELSGWQWHARGLWRTLRWRTWTGLVDGARKFGMIAGERGDTAIDQVSASPTRGRVYYHLYNHRVLLDDGAAAGLDLIAYHAGRELSEGRTFSPRVRQLDKQIFYVFRRP